MQSPPWLHGEGVGPPSDEPFYPEHSFNTLTSALNRIQALEKHTAGLRADAEAHERTTAAALEFTRRLSRALQKANATIDGLRNENATLHYLIGDRFG